MQQYLSGGSQAFHVFIHIGTHKTGTTSIQNFLKLQRLYLERNGFALCCSLRGKPNFKDLFHATVMPSRRADMVLRKPGISRYLMKWRLRTHISRFMKLNSNLSILASTELLSFLRSPQEIMRLKELFPQGTTFTVVLCLRQKENFLASLKRQLDAQKIPHGSRQGMSNYVEMDSWLMDYDSLKIAYKTLTDDIRIIDYEIATQNGQNIIAAFCKAIGITEPPDPSTFLFLNQRHLAKTK